jgi:hypothetical protein
MNEFLIYTLQIRNERNHTEEYFLQIDTRKTESLTRLFEGTIPDTHTVVSLEVFPTFQIESGSEDSLSEDETARPVDDKNPHFKDVEYDIIRRKNEHAVTLTNDTLDVEFYIEDFLLLPE